MQNQPVGTSITIPTYNFARGMYEIYISAKGEPACYSCTTSAFISLLVNRTQISEFIIYSQIGEDLYPEHATRYARTIPAELSSSNSVSYCENNMRTFLQQIGCRRMRTCRYLQCRTKVRPSIQTEESPFQEFHDNRHATDRIQRVKASTDEIYAP